jgi:hypothetical protein
VIFGSVSVWKYSTPFYYWRFGATSLFTPHGFNEVLDVWISTFLSLVAAGLQGSPTAEHWDWIVF